MQEETVQEPTAPATEPAPISHEEKVYQALQQEYLQLCSKAGEKQYTIATLRKELTSLNFKIRKINKKAFAMMEARRAIQVKAPS